MRVCVVGRAGVVVEAGLVDAVDGGDPLDQQQRRRSLNIQRGAGRAAAAAVRMPVGSLF